MPCTAIDELVANVECLTGASLDASGAITQPGLYRLCGNITGPLVISSDNVTLDLNGYSISSVTPTTSCAILVDNCTNVMITNGFIGPVANTSPTPTCPAWKNRGIAIVASSSGVTLSNIKIYNCAQNGIEICQSSNITVENCSLEQCAIGLYANQSTNLLVNNCIARQNSTAGFELFNCTQSQICGCKADGNGGNDNSYGFLSSGGTGNMISDCTAQGTTIELTSTIGSSPSYPLSQKAAGIALQDLETGSIIQNCVAQNTQAFYGASAYGILLDSKNIAPTSLDLGGISVSQVSALAWSPDGQCLVVGTGASGLYIFFWNGQTLSLLTTVTTLQGILSIAWSPNGQDLAVGTITGTDNGLYVYPWQGQSVGVPAQPVPAITSVTTLCWHPSGKDLAVGTSNGTGNELYVYPWDGQNFGAPAHAAVTMVNTIAWNPDGESLAVGAENNLLAFSWNEQILEMLVQMSLSSTVNAVAWDHAGQNLAVGTNDDAGNALFIYPWNGQVLGTYTQPSNNIYQVSCISWSPNAQSLAVGTNTGSGNELYMYPWYNQSLGTTVQPVTVVTSVASVAMES